MLRSAIAWIRAIDVGVRGVASLAKQVRDIGLQPQVLLDRHRRRIGVTADDLAVLGLEHREQAGLGGETGELDRVAGSLPPAERARDEDVEVAGAVQRHRPRDLCLQVVQVGDGRRRDVGDLVRHRDAAGRSLPCPKALPGWARPPRVVAVRAAGGVAPERCTPVFM